MTQKQQQFVWIEIEGLNGEIYSPELGPDDYLTPTLSVPGAIAKAARKSGFELKASSTAIPDVPGVAAMGGGANCPADPLGNTTVHVFSAVVPQSCNLYETGTKIYQGSNTFGQLLETISTTYSGTLNGEIAINVVPTNIQTTMGGSVKSVTKTYDTGLGSGKPIFGDVLTEQDYDWGASPHGPLLRQMNTSYLWQTNSSYATAGLLDLPSSVIVENGSGTRVAETDYTYDESAYFTASGITTSHVTPIESVRGNLSTVSKWLNTGSPVVSHTNWYDTGEPYLKIDPKSNQTKYAYSGTYAGAYPTTITNALGQITTNVYDHNTGLLTSTTDPNSQTTSFTYDTMFRKVQDSYPDGGQTTYCYTDIGGATCSASAAPFDLVITKKITSSMNLTETAVTDGLGRLVQTQLNSDPSGVIYVDTTYDADGRKYTVSNPYRTKTDSAYGITSTVYDALGRTCVVVPPDGTSVANTSCPGTQPTNDVFTTFSGNTTTVTDQQAKSRKSQTDGLGRLTNVWEDPASLDYETVYTYDPLGDLLTVVQGVSHNRTFVYDSLKRLTSSTNPETGTVTYTYDPDSNVATKLDARALTITYAYDALNRITGKTYSNGDPAVSYGYDGNSPSTCTPSLFEQTFPVGRRTSMCDAAGNEEWSYDSMGRELGEQRTSNSITKITGYTYNLDGSLATLTYPSKREVTYAYSGSARPLSVIDVVNSINYATNALYYSAGPLNSVTNGASLVSTIYYNNRLQPCRISVKSSGNPPGSCAVTAVIGNVLDYTYNFSLGTADNGNVMGITNNVDTTRSQSFTYDRLNRILTAETTSTFATSPTNCWGEAYIYDNASAGEFGNLTNINAVSSAYTGCTQESLSITALSNNQLSAAGFSYDASGNMLTDGRNTYTWNAEDQLKTAAGVTYTYDGDGHRVEKSNGKLYWYGTVSEPLTETDLSGNLTYEYIFFGGKRIARRDSSNNVVYYVADHLGTSRVVASSTGAILDQSDFYPFGGERVLSASSGNTYKFTSKERDTESNLDNFGARYDSSILGRFMSPDPLQPTNSHPLVFQQFLGDPRNWNKYAYSLDNPVKNTDQGGYFTGDDHEQMQMNAMLASGYSNTAAHVAAVADRRMDNPLNMASGVPALHHLTTDHYQNEVNPQHGERGDHQTREDAQAVAKAFMSSKVDDAAAKALQGDVRGALVDLGQASHTAQDIVRHDFETASQHPYTEAPATPAETQAAVQATQDVLAQFTNQLYQQGLQQGLSTDQISVIMQNVQKGPAPLK